jgi:hypothetical protein
VFLNKTDVAGGMDEQEVIKALDLERILTHRWVVVPCSAITGENLAKGLDWVVQDARDRLFLYWSPERQNFVMSFEERTSAGLMDGQVPRRSWNEQAKAHRPLENLVDLTTSTASRSLSALSDIHRPQLGLFRDRNCPLKTWTTTKVKSVRIDRRSENKHSPELNLLGWRMFPSPPPLS